MNSMVAQKGLKTQVKRYTIDALGAMAQGLFASLIIGLILKQLGVAVGQLPGAAAQGVADFLLLIGGFAIRLTGPAIALAIGHGLKAPRLTLYSLPVVGMMAYGPVTFAALRGGEMITLVSGGAPGGPVGVFLAALVATEVGRIVSGRTRLEILLVPLATLISGVLVGFAVGPGVNRFMLFLGRVIMEATELQPIPMGMIVSSLMGMILTLPISSAAISIMLGWSGLAAGAATVGCSCQMVGFAVASFRENRWGGLLSQGLGTSMLQVPNIIRNPRIWIPPTLSSMILGPLATTVFRMENNAAGGGMGTAGLVGQINTLAVMGGGAFTWTGILLLHFVLPALLTLFFSEFLRRLGWIKPGDMALSGK